MKIILIMGILINLAFSNVAFVSAYTGEANINRAGNNIALKLGDTLEKGDVLHTKNFTKVQLIFTDKTIITIGKHSTLAINDFVYDEQRPDTVNAKFNFIKGVFRTVSGSVGKINPSRFKIRASSATIGIRGTKFDVLVLDNITKIGVTRGQVYFALGNKIINIDAGEIFSYDATTGKTNVQEGVLKEYTEFNKKKSSSTSKISKLDNEQSTTVMKDIDDDFSKMNDIANIDISNVKKSENNIVENNNKDVEKEESIKSATSTITDIEDFDQAKLDTYFKRENWTFGVNDLGQDTISISNTEVSDFVVANKTLEENMPTSGTFGYLGNVDAKLNDITDMSGSINISVNFTNQSVAGNIEFDNLTQYNQSYQGAISNTRTTTIYSFDANAIGPNEFVYGQFLGTNGKVINGTFKILEDGGSGTVYGVYSAKQQ